MKCNRRLLVTRGVEREREYEVRIVAYISCPVVVVIQKYLGSEPMKPMP